MEGRIGAPEESAVRSAALRLAGQPLPMVAVARLYVCGITPYDVTHVGHAATFVWADVLASVVRMAGVQPVVCRNVTDVDDVLTRAAETRGRHYDEYALGQEFVFHQHMTRLGVRRPDHEPRARHHVTSVQQLAAALLSTDHAYARDGHVWFRGAGALEAAGMPREQALVRSAEYGDQPDDPRKDDPFDVPVWRPSGEHDPAWPSPWGWGRPGWHAECAAMAAALLGAGVDVLVGGDDLTFPHHAYQAAMVEAVTGTAPFARRVMHVGAVHQDGAKMAKSTGNMTLVGDLLDQHTPATVRLLLLDRAWSRPWEFRTDDLAAAAERLDRLYAAAARSTGSDAAVAAVSERLLDDLDVPGALDIAEAEGGAAARQVLATLALA